MAVPAAVVVRTIAIWLTMMSLPFMVRPMPNEQAVNDHDEDRSGDPGQLAPVRSRRRAT